MEQPAHAAIMTNPLTDRLAKLPPAKPELTMNGKGAICRSGRSVSRLFSITSDIHWTSGGPGPNAPVPQLPPPLFDATSALVRQISMAGRNGIRRDGIPRPARWTVDPSDLAVPGSAFDQVQRVRC